MLPFQLWSGIRKVTVEWKIGGVRIGPLTTTAFFVAFGVGIVMARFGLVYPGIVFVVVSFVLATTYAAVMTRLDPTGTVSERTQLRLLREGLRNRHSSNDIDWS